MSIRIRIDIRHNLDPEPISSAVLELPEEYKQSWKLDFKIQPAHLDPFAPNTYICATRIE